MNFKKILVLATLIAVALISCKKDDTQLDDDLDAIKSFISNNAINATEYQNIYCEVIKEGTGDQCEAGDTVAIKYTLCSISDTTKIIDQCVTKASTFVIPTQVPSTGGSIIPGMQLGLITMKEGGISRFYIPSTYAYGSDEINNESYANLRFEIELCEIKSYDSKH